MTNLFDDSPPPCPVCSDPGSRPLIFGVPSDEMAVAARLGDIALGGVADDVSAQWMCSVEQCGFRF